MQDNPAVMLSSQHTTPTHTLVHISDTHLIAGEDFLYGSTATPAANLKLLAEKIRASGISPDAIIFTGDIADEGQREAYQQTAVIIEPLAKELATEIIWVMGNHDNRNIFREELLHEKPDTKPVDNVYMINGLRIISLDTSVPGYHHGLVSENQLRWLEEVLAVPAEHGTILAMHHPPVPCVQPYSACVELQEQQKLFNVIKDSDIRSIIAGHLHYSSFGTFGSIPVSVASSTCYTQDLNTPGKGTRGRNEAQSFNVVNVHDEMVLHTVVPLAEGDTVGEFVSATTVRERLALLGL